MWPPAGFSNRKFLEEQPFRAPCTGFPNGISRFDAVIRIELKPFTRPGSLRIENSDETRRHNLPVSL